MVLSYDDALDDDGVRGGRSVRAAIGDFTVSAVHAATGIEYQPRVDSVWVRGYEVDLNPGRKTVYPGDTVTVDYTPGDAPQILDGADGNAVPPVLQRPRR